MGTFDTRVDAYIEKSADFARPILNHLRGLIHMASPEISETIKWGFPHFDYKGTVCSMASFKQHCAFGFWKSSLLPDPHHLLNSGAETAMGQFGRICTLDDLPEDEIMIEYIKNAVMLNEAAVKVPQKRKPASASIDLEIPDYFMEALSKNPLAHAAFEEFSNSHKKEYLEWITEAKTEQTREKRMATTLLWLSEGKSRNWKYRK
jgi:uncharacterized protein YdeI (YjbR/CyaY-like superfamily)